MSALKREFAPVLVWALFLTGLTCAQFAFMTESYSYGLLGGAALTTFLLGLLLLVRQRPPEDERSVPEVSYPAVALGLGAALAAIGVPFGSWLVLPGIGMMALGVAGLLRERRAERRGEQP